MMHVDVAANLQASLIPGAYVYPGIDLLCLTPYQRLNNQEKGKPSQS
jgi:hypothetical protein